MKETGPDGPGHHAESVEILRAKYLDYCSAQVAELLIYLTPDETYVLAERAAREAGQGEHVSYARMVEVATGWLFSKLTLPPFEVWVEDYQAHPERYEEYILGLWRSEPPSLDG